MIIIHGHGVNGISQENYDLIIENTDLLLLECPHCHHTGTRVHAYYDREVKCDDDSFRLLVLRVACKFCRKTHAVLLDTIVPYSSVPMEITIEIIQADTSEKIRHVFHKYGCLEFHEIYHIIRNFKRLWKERLASYGIVIDADISRNSICVFKRQFMQIPCTLCGSYG
jgi:hypothetical protein